jgi:hypothetical protein
MASGLARERNAQIHTELSTTAARLVEVELDVHLAEQAPQTLDVTTTYDFL